ncbi:MAG: sensor histidine kinase [Eubacteriales bacterium]|nr:sensor histidine kinase [Eubacteriales bacterium]
MKLRTKVFCIFSVIAILPLLILTMAAYTRYEQSTYQRMDEISGNLFENALVKTNDTLDNIKQTAGLFTFYSDGDFSIVENLKKFADPDKGFEPYEEFKSNQNIKFVCQNVLYSYDYIYGVYVFTPSGAKLGHTAGKNGDLKVGYKPDTEQWYQDTLALDGHLYVSSRDKHEMFSGGRDSVFFAQSLKDVYTHKFLGVLVIDCDPSLFDLSVVNSMPDITLLSIDNETNGCELYTNEDYISSGFSADNQQTLTEALSVPSLKLTAVFDYDALFREFSFTGVLLLLIAAACIAGILVLSYVFSKNLLHPIEHLSRKMATQKGHTLASTSQYLNRTDEIGTLYNEYNAMVEELNTSVKQDYQDKLIILDAQMKSLEARINSHFLFNTLESINSMAELDDNEPIATMSLALGNMFRYTIKTQSELVTVEQELSHVADYVSIQEIRFSHKFRLEVKLDPQVRRQLVLKLILQPLVENSLYHGLNYCSAGDCISIYGYVENNVIYLNVADNGQGMTPQQLDLVRDRLNEESSFTELGRRNKQSIGLKNIHSRIELYYGRGYGLSIFSEQRKGTRIEIKLPVIAKEEPDSCTAT